MRADARVRYIVRMVPTLPHARYLILDDADLSSAVAVSLAVERWGGTGPAPLLVPTWWRAGADEAMPLVHRTVEHHAGHYGLRTLAHELVVPTTESSSISHLLLAATELARQQSCDAVLFPVRAADWSDDGRPEIEILAREIDRAVMVGRLAALDAHEDAKSDASVQTPLVDLDDEQLVDLARDLAVPAEACWWANAGEDRLAIAARERWRSLRGIAGPIARTDPGHPDSGRSARSA